MPEINMLGSTICSGADITRASPYGAPPLRNPCTHAAGRNKCHALLLHTGVIADLLLRSGLHRLLMLLFLDIPHHAVDIRAISAFLATELQHVQRHLRYHVVDL